MLMFACVKLFDVTLSKEFFEDGPGVGTRCDINCVGHSEEQVKQVEGVI